MGAFELARWGDRAGQAERENEPFSGEEHLRYLNLYAMWILMCVVAIIVRGLFMAWHRINASKVSHFNLISRVLDAPVAFFDTTPLGRILNRFSSDIHTLDQVHDPTLTLTLTLTPNPHPHPHPHPNPQPTPTLILPQDLTSTINMCMNSAVTAVSCVGAVVAATKGTALALCVPLFFIYARVSNYYNKSNTSIARIEAVSRSPIYSDFSQALTGMSSIRAYRAQNQFALKLMKSVNGNSVALVSQYLAAAWLALRLDALGALIATFVALLAVISQDFMDPAVMGLALSYSFSLTNNIKV